MNYYERHLGDYARDTGHLSLLEHGVYTVLLDRYYGTEKGIPDDQRYRVARARSDDEREAVDTILNEFFVLRENLWVMGRVEQEIDKANTRINAARENGKKGGRPPKNNLKQTQEKPNGLSMGSEIETQSKAHQTPNTNTSPSLRSGENARASRLPADWRLPDEWREWAQTERKDLDVNETADRFRDYWIAVPGARGRKLDWQATWRNWVRSESGGKANAKSSGNSQGGRKLSVAERATRSREEFERILDERESASRSDGSESVGADVPHLRTPVVFEHG